MDLLIKGIDITSRRVVLGAILITLCLLFLLPMLFRHNAKPGKRVVWLKNLVAVLVVNLFVVSTLALMVNKPMVYVRTLYGLQKMILPVKQKESKIIDYPPASAEKYYSEKSGHSSLPPTKSVSPGQSSAKSGSESTTSGQRPTLPGKSPTNSGQENKTSEAPGMAFTLETKLPAYTNPDFSPRSPYRAQFKVRDGIKNQLDAVWYGPESKAKEEIMVWTPKNYSPTDRKTYNVIEFLHGYPGSPFGVPNALNFWVTLQSRIDSGKLPPTIVVIPECNLNKSAPTCADTAHGAKTKTWLTHDIPKMIRTTFPNVTDRRGGWMVAGNSSGAYCASRLGIVAGDIYGWSVALSGYDEPEVGAWGNRGSSTYQANIITNLLTAPRPWPVHFYASGGKLDRDSLELGTRLQKIKLSPGDLIHVNIVDKGGHNWDTWRDEMPRVFDWWANAEKSKAADDKVESGKITYHGAARLDLAKVSFFSLMGTGTIGLTIIFAILLTGLALVKFQRVWRNCAAGDGTGIKPISNQDKRESGKRRIPGLFWLRHPCFYRCYGCCLIWLVAANLSLILAIFLIINRLGQFYTTTSEFMNVINTILG